MMSAVAVCMTAPAYAMDDKMEMSDDMKMEKSEKMTDKKMEMLDTDNDGMVSKAEMRAHSDAMFAKSDTDNNGMISKEEMMESVEMKMEKHHMKKHDKHDMKKDDMMEK